MSSPKPPLSLRDRVARALQRDSISDKAWDRAVDEGHVAAAETDEHAVPGAGVEQLKQLFTDYAQGPPAPQRHPNVDALFDRRAFELLRARADALTAWAAAFARRDFVTFRWSVLGNTLLEEAEVDDWIHSTAEEADHGPGPVLEWLQHRNGERVVIRERVTNHPYLRDLGRLIEQIGRDGYGWTTWETLHFVLTDDVPWVSPVRVSYDSHHRFNSSTPNPNGEREGIGYDAFSTIRLDIDPSMQPDQVREVYRSVRNAVLGHRSSEIAVEKRARVRPPTKRVCALATFAAQQFDAGLTIETQRQMWNQLHPEWKASATHFGRDRRNAMTAVLGFRYQPQIDSD